MKNSSMVRSGELGGQLIIPPQSRPWRAFTQMLPDLTCEMSIVFFIKVHLNNSNSYLLFPDQFRHWTSILSKSYDGQSTNRKTYIKKNCIYIIFRYLSIIIYLRICKQIYYLFMIRMQRRLSSAVYLIEK